MRWRLFEPLAGPEAFRQRDATARAFADLYRAQAAELPPECRDGDYEKRIQAAYPIHPEIFDRLYSDWSTLDAVDGEGSSRADDSASLGRTTCCHGHVRCDDLPGDPASHSRPGRWSNRREPIDTMSDSTYDPP